MRVYVYACICVCIDRFVLERVAPLRRKRLEHDVVKQELSEPKTRISFVAHCCDTLYGSTPRPLASTTHAVLAASVSAFNWIAKKFVRMCV